LALSETQKAALLALVREFLDAPPGDVRWTSLWSTDGCVIGMWCHWSEVQEGDDPTEEELAQGRYSIAQRLAAGSDWSWEYCAVPLRTDTGAHAWALFIKSPYAEEPPLLRGFFEMLDEAVEALRAEGALHETGWPST
jgi:hypothetical protein